MNIKKKIKDFIYNLNIKKLLKNIILLESNPEVSDNTSAIYDELIRRNYNEKYKLIWVVKDKNKYNNINIKNVLFINRNSFKFKYYNYFAKIIIDANDFIVKRNKYQLRVHLTHGTPLKYAGKYCCKVGNVDYVLNLSNFFKNINKDLFKVNDNQILTFGLPRMDQLFEDKKIELFPEIKRKKTIFWFPTYRNHKKHHDDKLLFPFGIPCVDTKEELIELNDKLKKENILIVLKYHPAENTSVINDLNLENIKLITDYSYEFTYTLEHMFNSCDAFITDYSAVYYDLLLTKKPIGLAIPDLKDYVENTHIVFDNYEDYVKGDYIYKFKDLIKFIDNIANNKDDSYNDRIKATNMFFDYQDGNSSKRVLDFIETKIK